MRRIPVPVALLCVFTVSGFSGLIYESIWSHYLKLFLGRQDEVVLAHMRDAKRPRFTHADCHTLALKAITVAQAAEAMRWRADRRGQSC